MSACPICGQPSEPRHRPFCSKRCSEIDLGRWLNETYVIPTGPDEEEDSLPPVQPEAKPH